MFYVSVVGRQEADLVVGDPEGFLDEPPGPTEDFTTPVLRTGHVLLPAIDRRRGLLPPVSGRAKSRDLRILISRKPDRGSRSFALLSRSLP